MFCRFIQPLWKRLFTSRKILTTTAIFTYSLFKTKTLLSSQIEDNQDELADNKTIQIDMQSYMKELKSLDVCEGKHLLDGDRKIVTVKDHQGNNRKIIMVRSKGQLFAFLGNCPHREPFDQNSVQYSLQNAIFFNDKLFCPHHGCIFDIKSGSVQHGPSISNLPIFFARQKQGIINLTYPSAIPKYVTPNVVDRDVEDLRKVVILGGDDAATLGCVNGLRQFGFTGQVTVVKEGVFHYPYKKQYLHRYIPNLHIKDQPIKQEPNQSKYKFDFTNNFYKKTNPTQFKFKTNINIKTPGINLKKETPSKKNKRAEEEIKQYIKQQLQQKVYSKLKYHNDRWYEQLGIDFVFNDQTYRIINKKYYPYITFNDGTKIEFDGLLIATGVVQKVPAYESISINAEKDLRINLCQNVFSPYRSKEQHYRLVQFLNRNIVKHLLVLGYNVQSLEFIDALKKEFPDIKVSVIDTEKQSSIGEFVGADVQKRIVKQYTSRGIDFYIKISEELLFSNKFSYKNLRKNKKKTIQSAQQTQDPKLKYNESVTVRVADDLRLKADGVVIFPQQFEGNTEWTKNGKYTDFQFFHNNRISGDNFGRTDSIRIFTAGIGSCNQYFLLNKRLVSSNPHVSLQQGFNVGLNIQALRIPFAYVPFEYHHFFDKKLLYVGTRQFYDSMLIMGSIQDWDFITIYALGSQVLGASASPSRANHLTILRQAFRVNCMPMFQQLVNGYWSIDNLSNLIKKLNKSGCYRDLVFKNRQNVHKKDLIFIQRSHDAGFENDRPQPPQQHPSMQVGEGGTLKQL